MKKIGVLAIALVFALGTLGVGYAMWFDTLTIKGDVNTGHVDIQFSSQYDNDPAGGTSNDPKEAGSWDFTPQVTNDSWSGGRYNKDIANVASTFLNTGSWPNDADSATITINNGYPSYWASVAWDITNVGSIPVKLHEVTLTELSLQGSSVGSWTGPTTLAIGTTYFVDVEGLLVHTGSFAADDDFSFILSAYGTEQIDPHDTGGDMVPPNIAYLDVTIHVEQDAAQKIQYDFTIEYVFAQWNEGI